MIDTALTYLQAGLCILPADRQLKRPTLKGWKSFQTHRPIELQVRQWFAAEAEAICIVTGAISSNLEVLDFDCEASQFDDWAAHIPAELLNRLVMERSQSGGRHVLIQAPRDLQHELTFRCRQHGNVLERSLFEHISRCGSTQEQAAFTSGLDERVNLLWPLDL